MRKKTETERPRRSDYKGRKAVLVRIEPRQDAALTAEALRRAGERGDARPDKSEVVREALDMHPKLRKR